MRQEKHTVPLISLILMAALLGTGAQGNRPSAIAAPKDTCSIQAYVTDPDPNGLNIRSGPGKQFPVIARLPKVGETIVYLTGARGAWVLIDRAELYPDSGAEQDRKVRGWVYAPMLGTRTRSTDDEPRRRVRVYQSPNHSSPIVSRLPDEEEVALLGCHQKWAEVRHRKAEGWLDADSQCGNPLTTCP